MTRFSARRVAPFYGAVVVALLVTALGGLTADADAAVTFQGILTFEGLPPLEFTVVLEPGVSVRYRTSSGGRVLDSGSISATQSGSSVSGVMQSDDPGIPPCKFTAVLSGPRVDGVLDRATCGRSGSFQLSQASAAPTSGNPIIANLSVGFGAPCPFRDTTGTDVIVAFSYADADGNVQHGRVLSTATFSPSGGQFPLTFGIPGPGVTITGTTSGAITVTGCIRFGPSDGVTMTVELFDAAGNRSNQLSTTVRRPDGLPEVRPGAGPGPTKEWYRR